MTNYIEEYLKESLRVAELQIDMKDNFLDIAYWLNEWFVYYDYLLKTIT